jgi:hypothetical protein
MRDFSENAAAGTIQFLTLIGFDEIGHPLVPNEDGTEPRSCRSLVVLSVQDIGCELATTTVAGTPLLLILGRVLPALPVAEVDGERLVLEADREIVLRCGKSSITLKADGRVNVKGTQLLSRADGQNRVQGATVQLN